MLSWRVPTHGDPRLLRIALAQIGLASIVAALILLVAAPAGWLGPSLFGLIPLAIFMAYRRWLAYQRSMDGADNMRLDDAGLFWLDASGTEQVFRRGAVTSFHIGRDGDTLRPVPALTLHLHGGFESQPIELHPPATSDAVRRVLLDEWRIPEGERPAGSNPADYDAAVSVYAECHDDFQEWHWEGTSAELSRLFDLLAAAANELPIPPLGARPIFRTIMLTRREPARLRLAHSRDVYIDPDLIAAPADTLRQIASSGHAALTNTSEPADSHALRSTSERATPPTDAKYDVFVGPHGTWTFHLHVLPA